MEQPQGEHSLHIPPTPPHHSPQDSAGTRNMGPSQNWHTFFLCQSGNAQCEKGILVLFTRAFLFICLALSLHPTLHPHCLNCVFKKRKRNEKKYTSSGSIIHLSDSSLGQGQHQPHLLPQCGPRLPREKCSGPGSPHGDCLTLSPCCMPCRPSSKHAPESRPGLCFLLLLLALT